MNKVLRDILIGVVSTLTFAGAGVKVVNDYKNQQNAANNMTDTAIEQKLAKEIEENGKVKLVDPDGIDILFIDTDDKPDLKPNLIKIDAGTHSEIINCDTGEITETNDGKSELHKITTQGSSIDPSKYDYFNQLYKNTIMEYAINSGKFSLSEVMFIAKHARLTLPEEQLGEEFGVVEQPQ